MNTKYYISRALPLLSCFLMVIVYALYIIKPIPEDYTTTYALLYKTAVHLTDMIPFVLLAVFSVMQKTDKHRMNRSLPLYALAVKYVIDNIAYLLFATQLVKNLTFFMLAEEKILLMLIMELLLIAAGWIFTSKTFIVADILFLIVLSVFSYDVLHVEPTPLRIIWGFANFMWYFSLIPLSETMTIGNTFSKTYLKIVNYFRCKKGLDLIEPEKIISDGSIMTYDEQSSEIQSNGDDTL